MKRLWKIRTLTTILVSGLSLMGPGGSNLALAQLADVDPVLDVALKAYIAHDPDLANNPELAEVCRNVAEATVLDPVERAAVTKEVIDLQRQGVDVKAEIPPEVRERPGQNSPRCRKR